ncbi:NlpC/P60 family protein [Sporosarcina sp. FSL K6-2383]|uniref:C40 family peptidase n=1 Tax=Sporosarcina sp. FSL K6-2383 TaxID=2921556 RepID=UPI00315A5E7E
MKKKVFSMLATAALATFIATGSADAATESYTVKAGDTLWKIASQHKLSVDELKSLNKLTSDAITIDQVLNISGKITSPSPANTNGPATTSPQKSSVLTSSTNSWKNANTITTNINIEKLSPTAEKVLSAIVDTSLPLLDTPYAWAGITTEGFDCSGFIHYVYQAAGLDLPRFDTINMYVNSTYVDEPKIGDLVFFENTYRSGISHAGIYLGNGEFIHAGTTKVEISSLELAYWKDKFIGYKRFDLLY